MTAAARDPFAPVAGAGVDTVQRHPREERAWRPVTPIPDDAPPMPAAHRKLGRPVATWCYRAADGRPIAYELRFMAVTGGKETRPLTYCEHVDTGERRWLWQAPAVPRPIYGLERLAEHPEAPVVVCEGPKAADAAAARWPDVVAVSTYGGAQGARHCEVAALAGRHVVVWPDGDEPGSRYAAAVAVLAREAGAASVRVVALPDALPEGWDLADALPEGLDDARLRELLDAAPGAEGEEAQGEAYAGGVPRGYRVTPDGVEYLEEKEDGSTEWVRVCSRLDVAALTRSDAGEEWGRLLVLRDPDDVEHEWAMPMAMLAGDGTEARARLLSLGLRIEPGRRARERLHSYLTSCAPRERVRCVGRVGWHGGVFVLPIGTYGASGPERVTLQSVGVMEHAYRAAGTLADWQREVAAPCAGSSRLVLALSAAFAGPLLGLVGAEGGGIHLRGASSVGKTTALRVAASVWGPGGDRDGYVRAWRATANGLEAVAAAHSDTLLCLDELSQVDAREAGMVAYMLANGAGKSRAARDGSARAAARWRVLLLSSGEPGLADKIREDGRQRVTAGQAVRVVDIPADAGRGLGILEELHGFASARALADHLRAATATHYGVASPEYLAALTADREAAAAAIAEARRAWLASHLPAGADGQVARVAARLALVAAAGELATALGILPWAAGEAERGAARCYADWLRERGTAGPGEIEAGCEQVRAFFERYGNSRFEAVGDPRRETPRDRAGWIGGAVERVDGRVDGLAYLVTVPTFRAEIARGFDARALVAELVRRRWIIPGRDGRPAQSRYLPGLERSSRVYVFPHEIVGGSDLSRLDGEEDRD